MKNVSARWIVWFLLVVVLVGRGYYAFQLRDRAHLDPDAYLALAQAVCSEGTFGLHAAAEGSEPAGKLPTAFRPPLYPLLLVPLIAATPSYTSFVTAVAMVHLLLGLGTVAMVWLTAQQWQLSERMALLAALLVGLDPLLLRQSSELMTETLATFLAAAALLALSGISANARPRDLLILSGVLLGLCVLARPTFAVWVALVVVRMIWPGDAWGARLRSGGLLAAACLAILLPWMARNYVHFGKPIVTTTHGGYTLLRSNNAFYFDHLRQHPWGTPWNSEPLDQNLEEVYRQAGISVGSSARVHDELTRDEVAYQQAKAAIHAEPGMFVYASLLRLERLFGIVPWQVNPEESLRGRLLRYAIGVWYGVQFVLVLLGMATLGRRLFAPPWVWSTLLVLAFAAVHSLYWTDMRMRAPLVPVIALLAATGSARIAEARRGAPGPPESSAATG